MEGNLNKEGKGEYFSIRKIPVTESEIQQEALSDNHIDKIKILELSNIIDKWEQELLFSENGFFSLKGKTVEGKINEFVAELDGFIDSKIQEIAFVDNSSKKLAKTIKIEKIESIKRKMKAHEQTELKNWETEVYENAIKSSISRAVLYKSDVNIIESSLKNGLSVLKVMAENEDWTPKILKYREEKYKSEFYSSLIDAFIKDKNPKANFYFSKYKNILNLEDTEKFEKSIKELKNNVIAYNWARELFSYNMVKSEQEKEIKTIKDKEIEKIVRNYIYDFSLSEKKKEEVIAKEKNIKNWQEIIEIAKTDIDKALLYIDFNGKSDDIKSKKEYIKLIKKQDFILTDKKQFVSLLAEYFENFEKFKTKDISNYQSCFSKEDYELFSNLQKIDNIEFFKLNVDYKYVIDEIKKLKINKEEDKYNIFKLILTVNNEYKQNNNKNPDFEARNKLISTVLERFKNKM
ncbi:TPA: hypothetical protein IAA87_11045 [Candidatus Avigastranaerophilus faecigallinarum]|nr:hypothetical protein [Candidatus Avigastranaerophilus faecigallinarum]